MRIQSRTILVIFATAWLAVFAQAETYQKVGPSTGQPIPRYISIKSGEAFMRRGPSQEYPVDWVYHRPGFPVRVIGESGHWRKVEDVDGIKGWFHYALLSGSRTVLILQDKIQLHEAASENSQITAILQKGVVAGVRGCTENWCEVEVESVAGWLPKSAIWGVDAGEIFAE